MKLFRLALTLSGASLLAASLGSCLKAPEYSTTPAIAFDNITIQRLPPKISGNPPKDSVRITIAYQDGDGDMGLSSAERTALLGTPNFNNYYVEPYVKQVGSKTYQPLSVRRPDLAGGYNGGYPHVTSLTDNKAAPIRGTLTYGLAFDLNLVFLPGEKVKFSVQIADRARHLSNVIMTDSVVIGPR